MIREELQLCCMSLPAVTHDYKQEWEADRYHIGGKMFAMMGGDGEGKPLITLKCDPVRAEELRETADGIIPGYYMNKTHWNSIYLDAGLPADLMEELIRHSYDLVLGKLPKKVQQEVQSIAEHMEG